MKPKAWLWDAAGAGVMVLVGVWWGLSHPTGAGKAAGSPPATGTKRAVEETPGHSPPSLGSAATRFLPGRYRSKPVSGGGAVLPAAIETLLDSPGKYPDLRQVVALPLLTPEQQEVILERYWGTEVLTNRKAYIVLLAWKGDVQAGQALWHTLTDELAGKRVPAEWENVLLRTIPSNLAHVARRHPVLLDSLKAGSLPSYWDEHRRWIATDPAAASRVMAHRCVLAVGASGRPEALEILREVGQQLRARELSAAEVVDAAFYHAMVRRHGEQWFIKRQFLDAHERIYRTLRLFGAWEDSPEGREWSQRYP